MFWNIHLNVMISFQPRYNRQFWDAISYNTKSSPVWCRDYRTWFSILWQNGNTPESRVIFIKWILSSRVYSYCKYLLIKPIGYKLNIQIHTHSVHTYSDHIQGLSYQWNHYFRLSIAYAWKWSGSIHQTLQRWDGTPRNQQRWSLFCTFSRN